MKPIYKNPRTGPFHLKKAVSRFPFNESSTLLTSNARSAISVGVGTLGLSENDIVLIPAWTCGSEVDALHKSGLKTVLYKLNNDLSADFGSIRKGLENGGRAIYVIHYFGYSQNLDKIIELADYFDVPVIEDLALGLFSTSDTGIPLGSRGDMSVFSLVKTMYLPDGGALWLRKATPAALEPSKLRIKAQLSYLKKLTTTAGKSLRKMPDTTEKALDQWAVDADFKGRQKISKLSGNLVSYCDFDRLISKRTSNYDQLHIGIKNSPITRALMGPRAKGAVPAYFPLYARNAPDLSSKFWENGIESVRFWRRFYPDQNLSGHANIVQLKRNIIRLPIHHDINQSDIDRMIDIVNKFSPP